MGSCPSGQEYPPLSFSLMSYQNGRSYTDFRGINLQAGNGVLRFVTPDVVPTTTTGELLLYVNSSSQLVYDNGSSTTVIGAGGGGGTPTWETIFVADNTFTITPDVTFTIAGNRSTATDVLTLTNAAGGSGSVLQITNAGSGNDVDGTSNTWSVSKAGAATFLTLTLSGTTITSTAADVAWALEDNDATALSIGAAGETDMMVFDTRTGEETVTFNNNLNLTGGIATLVSASNTVSNLLVTNNTITTFGANAASAGMVVFRSTSLTTGSLLQLEVSDTALAGGFYLTCRESIGGTNDFTIGENGVIAMLGTAASDSLTITNGDVVVSDGSLTMVDADNAATLSITNDTATTASVFAFAGSGAFTGVTTSSFMKVTASGLTSGTVLYMPVAALTSGTGLHVVAATANFTTGGTLVKLDGTAATAGNYLTATTTGAYTGTGMILVTAGAATTGILVSLVSTTGMTSGSLLRATTSTAGAVATNGVISLRATGAFTSTANVGFVDVLASATTAGTVVRIASSAAGQTATELLRVDASGFTTGYTGSVATFTSASTTGASNVVLITAAATTAGNGLKVVANGLTLGAATGILVSHTTSVLGAGTSLLRLSSTGVDTGTTTGVLLDLASTSHTTATLAMITDSSADTSARIGLLSSVTNTAAVLAVPLKTSNVAVVNSKFTKHLAMTDGTKTCNIWISQDNTDPNGTLTGLKGDLCLNAVSGKPYYCTADGTSWAALV